MRSKVLAAGLLAASAWACHQAILTAPVDSQLRLVVNPPFIDANGGRATVSALVIETLTGTVVPDGTVVQFETTLGRIDEQGKTNDGIARVNLVADGRSGTAQIVAFSGLATDDDTLLIGNASATIVQVSADPPRIRPNDPRVSAITATVVDANGNFLKDVPLRFGSTATPAEEEIDTGLKFTDSNGQASVTLRTRRDREAPPKDVTVTATTANGIEGSTIVVVN